MPVSRQKPASPSNQHPYQQRHDQPGHEQEHHDEPPLKKQKRTRVRTGCLNCRRRKRRCDESRPSCGACSGRNETCQWGVKVTFRAENAQTILGDHPSMKVAHEVSRPRSYDILDITDEVIRDYHLPPGLVDHESEGQAAQTRSPYQASTRALCDEPSRRHDDGQNDEASTKVNVDPRRAQLVKGRETPESIGSKHTTAGLGHSSPSSSSQVVTDNAVANLLYLSQGGAARASCSLPRPPMVPPTPVDTLPIDSILAASPTLDSGFDFNDHIFTPEGSYDDGIFFPGSAYHELHSTLRNHLIQEVNSHVPTRSASPDTTFDNRPKPGSLDAAPVTSPAPDGFRVPREQSSDHESPVLSPDEECALWKNWIDEISPWLDKFDDERHFQHTLPQMARSHQHLRYSMLALSARQLELKDATKATGRSLDLYQEAIHLLLPLLSTRTTPVIASCLVLCVLEMCSCSPKAWRRHLDGCASLMQAVGMTGFVGGLEQALFWAFARMDVCGGLISSVKTLIPTESWASKMDFDADVALFASAGRRFTMWANYAVYLVAQVLDLLAPLSGADAGPGRLFFFDGPKSDMRYRAQWAKLWRHIEDWHARRPPEMRHVVAIRSSETKPFPTILYSNAAAISGNQLYHTASLLMLQNRPPSLRLGQRPPRSALWHARQICGISTTNHHHGAWTNSIQPLWIAGRCMSHPAEHKAILQLLEKIERESGWSTKWRADDLKEFWGDLGDDE